MSRCKQRAKKAGDESGSGREKKRGKEQDEEELLQDKWTSWRPERVTDEGYATSEYISCSRVALYSMHESIYMVLDDSIPRTVPESRQRLASVPLYTDGTYDLSNVDTTRLTPRVICTSCVSPSGFPSFSVSSHVSKFMEILRKANDQRHFMT